MSRFLAIFKWSSPLLATAFLAANMTISSAQEAPAEKVSEAAEAINADSAKPESKREPAVDAQPLAETDLVSSSEAETKESHSEVPGELVSAEADPKLAVKVTEQRAETKAADSPKVMAKPKAKANAQKATKAKPPVQEGGELPRIALTKAPKDDLDFNLLGEFVGPIEVEENRYEPIGLQIRPIGGGEFEALQYAGGLPGQDSFTGEKPTQLVGRRNGDFIVLSGGEYAVFVEAESCLLVDRTGKRVGRLERIERGSPTMGAAPPSGATVLFDGSGTNQFTTANMTEDGLLKEGADTLPLFQDFNLHVEFRLPYMPNSDGQKRGNSGCYLQSRYEVQVLDSFA
ncbi:MAG: family 16 glycoside hydrolase, partial [Planctomycetota bacterium]